MLDGAAQWAQAACEGYACCEECFAHGCLQLASCSRDGFSRFCAAQMSYAVAQAGVQLLYASRRPFFAMLSWQCKRQSPHGRGQRSTKQCQTMPNNAANKTCSGAPRRAMATGVARARVAAPEKRATLGDRGTRARGLPGGPMDSLKPGWTDYRPVGK